MADYDITVRNPLRVGIAVGQEVVIPSTTPFVRVRGRDLREVAHRASAAREQNPESDVLVDIDVVIAPTASGARDMLAANGSALRSDTIQYIGTPAGLAGLINDIHAVGIADGAVLQPLSSTVADLIRESTLPHLRTMGAIGFDGHESQSA